MEDIEDLVVENGDEPQSGILNAAKSLTVRDVKAECSAMAKVWVRSYGCSHNFSDGEYMAGQLQAYGYR